MSFPDSRNARLTAEPIFECPALSLAPSLLEISGVLDMFDE